MKTATKLPKTFFDEIYKIIGKEGTIMVPSHTFNLVNTNKIFNPYKTKSISGSFSNYIIENKKFEQEPFTVAKLEELPTTTAYSPSITIGVCYNFLKPGTLGY
mgnify:CR=1 FL=1